MTPRTKEDQTPLYPSEQQIARLVLGERSKSWTGLSAVLEKQGLPPIDPLFGGRYWPAVKAFLDRRHHVNKGDRDAREERRSRA